MVDEIKLKVGFGARGPSPAHPRHFSRWAGGRVTKLRKGKALSNNQNISTGNVEFVVEGCD